MQVVVADRADLSFCPRCHSTAVAELHGDLAYVSCSPSEKMLSSSLRRSEWLTGQRDADREQLHDVLQAGPWPAADYSAPRSHIAQLTLFVTNEDEWSSLVCFHVSSHWPQLARSPMAAVPIKKLRALSLAGDGARRRRRRER